MDIIDKNFEKYGCLTKNPNFVNKIWSNFFDEIFNKRLILYGVTQITSFLWIRYKKKISISAVIDNSQKKLGQPLGNFFDEDDLKDAKDIIIQSKEILKEFDPNEVVILISSVQSCDEIANELEKNNFCNYFSAFHMECYYREHMKKNNLTFSTLNTYRNDYAKKCISKYQIQDKKVIFFDMGVYLDHGKYITEQLLAMNENIDIVWFTNDDSINIPKKVRSVKVSDWKNFIYEMETAKIWIINVFPIPTYLIKREDQVCIQIKHWGSITLKKFYLDDIKDLDKKNTKYRSINLLNDDKKIFKLNGMWTDYIISGSDFDEDSCRKGFNFNNKFIRCGSPRSDILFNPKKYKEDVYRKLNLKNAEHILLYVPTYRRYKWENEKNSLNYDILLQSLKQKWKGKWKILLRLHPYDKNNSKKIEQSDHIIDVSHYDDGQELVAATDVMVSDYSSIMFDPAYVMKPVFLYAPDREIYLKKDRDFLIDYDSLPFPISITNEELSEQILNFDETVYKQKVRSFLNKYGVHEDGHASERAANFILNLLSKEGECHA
ncbi:MAG: CDP-glycerol glycerophosphotransferase family protein [Selenomonadaceae bacterium]|nr:CDP-glycerol glycerophosphotransferase family protein [Selenomonadaceae bacterium]